MGQVHLRSVEEETHSLRGDKPSGDRGSTRLEAADDLGLHRCSTNPHQGRRPQRNRNFALCTRGIRVVKTGGSWGAWDGMAVGNVPCFIDIEDVDAVYRLVSDLREKS